jgi:peptidyl-dipeptidase A
MVLRKGIVVILPALLAGFAVTSVDAANAAKVPAKTALTGAKAAKPTVADAEAFLQDSEARLQKLGIDAARAGWVSNTFITDDTEVLAAQASARFLELAGQIAIDARKYNSLKLPADSARKLKLLQQNLVFEDAKDREAYTRNRAAMTAAYGKGKYCPPAAAGGSAPACMPLGELEDILASSHDPAKLKEIWLGWHSLSPAYKQRYAEFVELSNKGARAQGYADTGALWRSRYDMPPEAFAAEMERNWQQVKPLYDSLHTYARYRLRETYGPDVVPAEGPIPAHLFGNMWSQTWDNLYPLLKPKDNASEFDLTKVLTERKTSAQEMTRYAEGFYTSLGMEKLPPTFWDRSLLVKPRDREVVCHASAWDVDNVQDVRIKLCITPTSEHFETIHHELGHIYYDLAYRVQPPLFRGGANDGFHEAIGDTVTLSITPDYLQKVGLMQEAPPPAQDIAPLLQRALKQVAFLPFGYLIDQWRWQVYSGQVKPADYDKAWWALREKYQGIKRPAPMAADGFDAGAKFHVANDTPYARYFLAAMLQFQFHRALCREAGYTGPLHRCSVFGNKKAGEKFQAMLTLGRSKPWPEALHALTGEDRIDGSAILEYFAPLKVWLDQQNRAYAEAEAKPVAQITEPAAETSTGLADGH